MQNRKQQEQDRFIFRLPGGWRDFIKSQAKAARRSMNAEIILQLEKAYGPAIASVNDAGNEKDGATALLTAGASNRFLELVAEYRALEAKYNTYPGDVPLAAEQKWIARSDDLEDEMAETPVTSSKAALEAIRLVNHRMDGSEATSVDRAILRSAQLFMEA